MVSVPKISFNNGQDYPAIGLGTWKSEPGAVAEAVKDAIDVGYRHIDCAHIYLNEKEVGDALKQKIREGVIKREDIVVTSKLWCTHHNPKDVERACKISLKDLGLDRLDLYLIHWPQAFKDGDELLPKDAKDQFLYSDVDYVDTWKAMEGLVSKGLVTSIGLSNFNRHQIERVLDAAAIKPAAIQIEVHPYLSQKKLIEFCKFKDIAVIAYSPLGSPDRPWAKPEEPSLMEDPRIKEIASKYKKTPAQILIRFALDRGLIVIPKSVTKSRIQQNFEVFDFRLTPGDLAQIATLECNGRLVSMGDVDHKHYPFHDEY